MNELRPRIVLCAATMEPRTGSLPGQLQTFIDTAKVRPPVHVRYNTREDNRGVVGSYDELYRNICSKQINADVLGYVHDDVIMREDNWDERVRREFEDPTVGVVGFGGARRHGSMDIYKTPYRLQQLGRSGYLSNVDDAEVHGERFTGTANVAVLDGFALFIRREFLDRIGGWAEVNRGCDFFCYDYAICALAHRHGFRVRVVGGRCHHLGGVTSVKTKGLSVTSQEAYDNSHQWFYNEFRDVMPWEC